MTKETPLCPECKQPLETIVPVTQGVAYWWDEEEGKYEVDDAQETVTFLHDKCGKPVGGWRADGVKWGFLPEVENS